MPNKEKSNKKNGVIKAKAEAEANGALGYHCTVASFWKRWFFGLFLLLMLFVCLFFFFTEAATGEMGESKFDVILVKRNNKSFHRCLVDTVLSNILLNVRMRLFEGGDYLKYFHLRGAIIRGRRLIEGPLLFEGIRFSRWSAPASLAILHLLLLSALLFKYITLLSLPLLLLLLFFIFLFLLSLRRQIRCVCYSQTTNVHL